TSRSAFVRECCRIPSATARACGVRKLDSLRRTRVLVKESAETVATFQRYRLRPRPRRRRRATIRRRQVQAAVRPPTVVVITEHGERERQMAFIQDQQPVQTLGSSGPDEPFSDSIRLRHLNRRANDSGPLTFKHRIEAGRKLAVVIADQK